MRQNQTHQPCASGTSTGTASDAGRRIALDVISIAAPCTADWASMAGDNRVRHCDQCDLNVYNLSGMTRPEAEAFVTQREGRLCVRYFKRADGTVLTQDCPVGLAQRVRHAARCARIRASAAAILLIGAFQMGCDDNVATVTGQRSSTLIERVTRYWEVVRAAVTAPASPVSNPAIMGEIAVPMGPAGPVPNGQPLQPGDPACEVPGQAIESPAKVDSMVSQGEASSEHTVMGRLTAPRPHVTTPGAPERTDDWEVLQQAPETAIRPEPQRDRR